MKNRKELPALLVMLGLAPAAVAQLSTFRVTDYPGQSSPAPRKLTARATS